MKKTLISCALILAFSTSLAIAGGDVAAGKTKSLSCAACHGADGISLTPLYPNIGGQYEDYLLHSIKSYKSGKRQNAIMQGMTAALSETDMEDLAAYFASLPGALKDGSVQP